MENNEVNMQPVLKNKIVAGWVFGGLSFIPLIGVLFGIIAIIIGIVKKSKGPAILGLCGILVTVIIYGSLFYFGFVAKTGVYADLRVKLATQTINTDAGQIALYKNKNGKLPEKFSDLGQPTQENLFFPSDPWMTDILYKPNVDGTFELISAGPDKVFNTSDDIVVKF